MTYICPMHPEIESEKQGKCPKCGMKLVEKGSEAKNNPNSYAPLVIIISLIIFVSLVISIDSGFSFSKFIYDFMIGFFLVFSGFKLIDLNGFAEGYSTYDLWQEKSITMDTYIPL